jgi:hypothetical protein
MANRGCTWRQSGLLVLYSSVAILVVLPTPLHGQAKGTVSKNPVNPIGLPPIVYVPNYPRPWRPLIVEGKGPVNKPLWWDQWSFDLSAAYQFLNQRSRVGDVSLDAEFAIIDFAALLNKPPFTSLDISYTYSYASGSSPAGSQTVNQHVGSLRLIQPILGIPASLNVDQKTDELAIIVAANYGNSLASTGTPLLPSVHSSAHTFLGNALLDYQHGCFPNHHTSPGRKPPAPEDNYPSLLFELSSGIQFNTIRFHSSDPSATTSSSRQLTYQNIGSLTVSLPCRLGFLVGAEWDAPLFSDPLRNSQPYYANIAVFTAGLVYNYYPRRSTNEKWNDRLSLRLLYSYTAFDPLTETNALSVQVSWSF